MQPAAQSAAYPAARRMPKPRCRAARNALCPAPPPCGACGISPVYAGKGTRMAASVNRESIWAGIYAPPATAANPVSRPASSPVPPGVWA